VAELKTRLEGARRLELVGTKGIEVVRMLVDPPRCGARHMAVMMGYLPPGGDSVIHAHPEEEAWYLIKGRCRAYVGDKVIEMEPGSCVFVPGDCEHHLTNVGDEESMHICVHAPARPLPLKSD